jgi:hypothetical protein
MFVAVGSKIIVGVEVGMEGIALAVGVDATACAGIQDAMRRMKNCVIATKRSLLIM